ncbi:uncharacterized protein V1510DRAFT_412605 [Dipodascopsis tothii]|uniref:uncharacterized protein n=1 Tax=Dipodascopsis tothii TaxID=44089 RepID=UPI0034CFF271
MPVITNNLPKPTSETSTSSQEEAFNMMRSADLRHNNAGVSTLLQPIDTQALHEHFVGKRLVSGQATSADEISENDLPQDWRVLHPDSFATADYRPERVTLHVDAESRVRDLKSG